MPPTSYTQDCNADGNDYNPFAIVQQHILTHQYVRTGGVLRAGIVIPSLRAGGGVGDDIISGLLSSEPQIVWDALQPYRIKTTTRKLYPYRQFARRLYRKTG